MKTSFLTLTLAAATLILGSAGLRAQEDPTAGILKRFDRNGDGRLDEAEKVVAKETMAREARPGPANRRPQNPQAGIPGAMRERLAEFDRNGDGRLDESERAAARAQIENRLPPAPRPQGPQNPQAGPFRPAPRGNVGPNPPGRPGIPGRPESLDELRARAEGNPRVLNRFDRNGDGRLDDTELAAARQQLGARRGPPNPPPARAE